MKQTDNYKLSLYDAEDKFSITAEENSLNANMKIIDEALYEKITSDDMASYIESKKNELKGASGVYVGSGDMPDGYNVQIDIDGEAIEVLSSDEAMEIIVEELAKRGQLKPEFANSIDECTDTSKLYVLPDGYVYAFMESEQTVETGENILPSLDAPFGLTKTSNGLYFGVRPSSSSPYYTSSANCNMTGVIPVSVGDCPITLYIKGVTSWGDQDDDRICLYGSSGEPSVLKVSAAISGGYCTLTQIDTGYYALTLNATYFTFVNWTTVTSAVLSFKNTTEGQNIEISREEFGAGTVTDYQWTNTKHAFVPANYEDRIISLENLVNDISAGTGGTFTYVANEAIRVANTVKEKQTVGSLTFTAMSDMHIRFNDSKWADNLTACRDAGLGLAELQKHLKLDCAVMLGDYTVGGKSDNVDIVKDDLSGVRRYMADGIKGISNIWCTGNHDINYGASTDRRMTDDEMYAYLISNNTSTIQDGDNIERNYGYIDFENQKIRCIYLNTVDSLDYSDLTGTNDDASEITAAQIQWLVDVGLDFTNKLDPSKWGIVVFSHHCLSIFPHVVEVLKGYKDRTKGSVNAIGLDINNNLITESVEYDFTSLEKRAEVICSIHGHNHNFMSKKISDEGYNQITVDNAWLWSIGIPNVDTYRDNDCASYDDEVYANAFGEFDPEGNPVYYPKTQGTAKSTSFCVITIDRKNRKIHAVAYGAGKDREINYGKTGDT